MTYRTILIEKVEPMIAQITLNRPKQMNAYTGQMCDELVSALHDYMEDDSLRCLVLTGAGKGFCSGGDVGGQHNEGEENRPTYRDRQMGQAQEMRAGMHRVILALHRMDKPTIAMINGPAVAGGLTLALACDFRIAAQDAKIGDSSGRFGLLPDEGGAWFFPRFMGLDHALKMSLLHEIYSADQAAALGLVTETVPNTSLRDKTFELARDIAARAPLAVRLAKNMMRKGLHSSLENSLDDAALSVMIANPSQDVREGVKAFFEKRTPKFEGR